MEGTWFGEVKGYDGDPLPAPEAAGAVATAGKSALIYGDVLFADDVAGRGPGPRRGARTGPFDGRPGRAGEVRAGGLPEMLRRRAEWNPYEFLRPPVSRMENRGAFGRGRQ